ncbi:putative enoyl-CoA hydratase echA8 [Alphaproteobacteria bacterium SO-S41]|nr:putative enoyl-CoA hydratase echA8 [Alphaproteobacteria bacterium SO-S41]
MGAYRTIELERRGGIATLAFNRPDRLNGITNAMMRELHHALRTLDGDPDLRVLILTGRGKGFCPGADVTHYADGGADEALRSEYFDITRLLHEISAVTIAAINGACAGAGLGWAAACDLRYAAETAKFNSAFLGVGISGDMALPWLLPRIVGATRARELCFFPRKFTTVEALDWGFLLGAYPAENLMREVEARAATLAAMAAPALMGMKQNFISGETMSLKDYIAIETARHSASGASPESRAAFKAFGKAAS